MSTFIQCNDVVERKKERDRHEERSAKKCESRAIGRERNYIIVVTISLSEKLYKCRRRNHYDVQEKGRRQHKRETGANSGRELEVICMST